MSDAIAPELDDYGRLKARERLLASINDIRSAIRRLRRIKGVDTDFQQGRLGIVDHDLVVLRKRLDR